MKKLIFVLIFLFVNCFAHEHWIDLENSAPSVGTKTKVFVKSGHNFPKSEFVLGKNLLKELKVISPNKKIISYQLDIEKDARSCFVVFDSSGSYVLYFVVSRPPENEEVYFGKSIINIGKQTEVSNVGSKLEIIPYGEFKQNNKIKLQVLFDKKPIKTTISVSVEGKKNFFVQTNNEGVVELELKYPKRYLITTSYKKYGCSLTFFVGEKQ